MVQHKTYPSYKPSGIEWIGEIPEGWELRRLRFTGTFSPKKSSIYDINANTEVQFVPMELVPDTEDELKMEQTAIYSDVKDGYTYFQNNDVVIAKITPCFENGKGAIANNLINGIGFGTTELHVIRPNNNIILSKFLFLLTKLKAFREIGESMMKGSAGQKRVPELFIKDCFMPLPPLPEQQAIASFLDRETARINRIIEKQTRLIELLKEKRSALITQAVTRGLDPNAKMKDSGVEWIGEIPEGWEVYKIKFMIEKSLGGGTPNTSIPSYWDGEIPWVSPKDMKVDVIKESEEYITEKGVEESSVNMIPADSLLCVFRSGILKHTFPIAINEIPVTLNQDMKALIPDIITTSAYLFWLFSGFNKTILNLCVKVIATVDSIESKYFYNLVLPLPNVHEQKIIIDYLTKETSLINNLMLKIEKQIDLLNEYKQSLITAAVTGKIDVRNVQ